MSVFSSDNDIQIMHHEVLIALYHRTSFNILRSLIIVFVSFSDIANLIIVSAQIARRGELLIE